MTAEPVTDAVFTPHARSEMARRGLSEGVVRSVLSSPEQRLPVRDGRDVLQSVVVLGEPAKRYLVRVFVDIDRQPPAVVTAYQTSKVDKYWSPTP